jgi:2'-5' RNA ligase
MRLFFAFWPDNDVRNKLASMGRNCLPTCRGRLVPPRNLHVTLAFLGEVDAHRLDALCRIGASLRAPAFTIEFDRIGSFRRSGIVYAGVSEVSAPVVELEANVRSALAAAGFRFERRRFVPHVTLIRDARAVPSSDASDVRVLWQVRHIVLVESARVADAQVYRPLRRFMLAP